MLRSPVTANSRPTISTTIQAGTTANLHQRDQRRRNQQLVRDWIQRSVPMVVTCFQRRARYPLQQIGRRRRRKIASASRSLVITVPRSRSTQILLHQRATSHGTKKNPKQREQIRQIHLPLKYTAT